MAGRGGIANWAALLLATPAVAAAQAPASLPQGTTATTKRPRPLLPPPQVTPEVEEDLPPPRLKPAPAARPTPAAAAPAAATSMPPATLPTPAATRAAPVASPVPRPILKPPAVSRSFDQPLARPPRVDSESIEVRPSQAEGVSPLGASSPTGVAPAQPKVIPALHPDANRQSDDREPRFSGRDIAERAMAAGGTAGLALLAGILALLLYLYRRRHRPTPAVASPVAPFTDLDVDDWPPPAPERTAPDWPAPSPPAPEPLPPPLPQPAPRQQERQLEPGPVQAALDLGPPPSRLPPRPPAPTPAPHAPAPPALRPWLEIVFLPQRVGIDATHALVEFKVEVHNIGSVPARDVRVVAQLLTANPHQNAQLDGLFSSPRNRDRPLVDPALIEPGGHVFIEATGMLGLDRVHRVEAFARPMFVPILAVRAVYGWGDTGEGEGATANAFILGVDRGEGDKMGPFWLDAGPSMTDRITYRLHEVGVRR